MVSRWREVVLITARYYEPGNMSDDSQMVSMWRDETPSTSLVQFEVTPLWCGSGEGWLPTSLVGHHIDGTGRAELLDPERGNLLRMFDKARRIRQDTTVALLTVWECEAGVQYTPGEPDEYVSDVQLIGHLAPRTLEFVPLEAPDAS